MKEHYVEIYYDPPNTCKLDIPLDLTGSWSVCVDEISFQADYLVTIEYCHKNHSKQIPQHELTRVIKKLDEILKLEVYIGIQQQAKLDNRINEFHTLVSEVAVYGGSRELLIQEIANKRQNFIEKYVGDNKQSVIDELTINIPEFQSIIKKCHNKLEKIQDYEAYYDNKPIDRVPQIKQMYIGVDVIDPRFTIKTCYPKQNQHYNHTWDKSQYYTVNKTYIENISVSVRDKLKSEVELIDGPVYLKLHFKKIK
jgi:hypothetical protein